MQADIEALATGSTGQTELSRDRLGTLPITLPNEADARSLERILLSLENQIERMLREIGRLASMRDALLPELMSGRIRVPEAREAVDEVTG